MDHRLISQLTLDNGRFTITARVTRIWESTNPRLDDKLISLDVIMVDKEGTPIQGTIWRQDAPYYRRILKEGEIYVISNFAVTPNKDTFRAVQNGLLLRFSRFTSMKKIENTSDIPEHTFSFVGFDDISDRVHQDAILTDVVGHIVSVGHIDTAFVKERVIKKKNLNIKLQSGEKVQVTLWAKLAEEFPEDMILEQECAVVVVLAGMTVRPFAGEACLCSCSASKFYFDLAIPEVLELKQRLADYPGGATLLLEDTKAVLSAEEETKINRKSIFELQCLDPAKYKDTLFACQATIRSIDATEGWWYRACPKHKIGLKTYEGNFWCDKCLSIEHSPLPCYKLNFVVEDKSGQLKFIAFGKTVEDIVEIPCAVLAASAQYDDRFTLPLALEGLIGKTYVFKVLFGSSDFSKKTPLKVRKIIQGIDIGVSSMETNLPNKDEASSSTAKLKEVKVEPSDDISEEKNREVLAQDTQLPDVITKKRKSDECLQHESATASAKKVKE